MATTRRFDRTSSGGRWLSRRAALIRLGGAGVAATVPGLASRPAAAARQAGAGPTREEADILARGIADALTSDPDRLEEWVATDVVGHVPLAPDGSGKGLAGLKEKAALVIAALPDATITVAGLAVDGDTVAAHGEIGGTHDGSLAGLPATGQRVRVQYVIFARVVSGKVAEYWYQLDALGALHQLEVFALGGDGAAPTPDDCY